MNDSRRPHQNFWQVLLLLFLLPLTLLAKEDRRLRHWAWQPLQDLPADSTIDSFLEAKLSEHNLTSSPNADRRTLIRRLSFDLHGLPPSPKDIQTFLNDQSPDAYARLVDRMLASPHYGERFARHWLDIAHYADTHGFERDKRRPNAWRYRDYVIDAFNSDKPYHRFLQEQIAGDVLWPDKPDAVIATGFLAAGPWDFVGQKETKSPVLRRSARALDLDDMATQVMTSTMGITVNCARCHDHKLDPISQKEYFQFQAVFAGVKREERVISTKVQQSYEKEKIALEKQLGQLSQKIGKLEGAGIDLADIVGGGDGLGSGNFGQGIDPRNAVIQTRKFGNLGNVVPNKYSKSKFPFVDGVFIADGQDGKAEIPVSTTGLTISGIPTTNRKAWDHIRFGPVASQHSPSHGGIDFTKDGHTLLGIHANAGITFDLEAIRKASGLGDLQFTTQVGYFGAAGGTRADVWIFLDGELKQTFKHLKRQDGLQLIDLPVPAKFRFLTLLATDGENNYSMDQIGFGDPKLRPTVPQSISEAEKKELVQLRKARQEAQTQLDKLGPSPKFYGVVPQKPMPPVRMQSRGNPESEFGDPLAPGAFSALKMLQPSLGNMDSTESQRRQALAEWITHPKNPLTPRVIVNRLWHWHFGQGIVNTPSDFGLGGSRPTHPELLDWLAAELIRQDWSLKALHRKILLSKAYQQISHFPNTDPRHNIDATNRFLWRQNPRRIEAEAVRDAVLSVSGKLNKQRGGPGFEDFKYKEAYAPEYTYITADEPKLWRRSIYRYIVRTTPDRFMTTLDCPDPANFTPKRLTTTTPLQSLALFNNEFMLKQARYFANRLQSEAGDNPADQVNLAFQLAFSRNPTNEELTLASNFATKPQGLFALCRSLFNANEFVYVD